MRTSGWVTAGLLLMTPLAGAPAADDTAAAMVEAAGALLAGLTPEQRAEAVFDLADEERINWHFIPRQRRGVPLKVMDESQRALARALLETGLSHRGLETADTIMSLEQVLFDMGDNPGARDPERYYFSVFGDPAGEQPWGWRVEGHHLSLNFTIVEGTPVAWSPAFFGANPAQVRSGPRTGLRALAAEEDLARALVTSLSEEQRAVAIVAAEAPAEMLTEARDRVEPLSPPGIASGDLTGAQRSQLSELLDVYLSRMTGKLAERRRAAIEEAGMDAVTFAWSGVLEPGGPHYYRIQGPSFLVEYDNTQNEANHVHTVWRDFAGDFGRDLLQEHYREAHANGDGSPHVHGSDSGHGH